MSVRQYKYDCALVIDDDATDIYINKRILELSNFARKIIVKTSCSEALAYLNEAKASSEHIPDVVFLDYFMPVCNGKEFLEKFKSLPAHVTDKSKVVMLSVMDEAMKPGTYDKDLVVQMISKPLTQDKLEGITIVSSVAQKNS